MAKPSTTQQSIVALAGMGWKADIVERRITPMLKKDFLGFGDIIAICPEEVHSTLVLQVTSASNLANRVTKMLEETNVDLCLAAGWRVEAWGWKPKPDAKGNRLVARTFEYDGPHSIVVVEGSQVHEDYKERATNG